MKTLFWVCSASALMLFLAAAIEPPVVGRWEGERHGLKSAAIAIRAVKNKLEGDVVFWVDRDGRTVGMDQRPLIDPRWDGKTLRFSVGPVDLQPGAPVFKFEMTVTGRNTALLKRLKSNGAEELTVPLLRNE